MKKCSSCKTVKDLVEFYKRKDSADGYRGRCKSCCRTQENIREVRSRQQDPIPYRKRKQRARARKAGVFIEDVDELVVYERNNWICQICFEPVDKDLRHPDRMARSMDHIVPIAKGGQHCYDNVQLAHFICNTRKGDKIAEIQY